ncbi:phosphotriesterase-related protein [Thermocatellispora tengchongensis]|uniref:Phosphotriesterase-related protein n=2 Tax=Thermocatellispora tengchongensis TaxID=1073253 RepID=A0A840PBW1_9ACTN|nr:phosphotriesterase [Thermocatellispora tengchongensis]MBB5136176.1 phosphotriesterase-related protein [Thermocatellispora tengchongensis]
MATIPTAASTIDSAEMGRTLAHEHVFVLGTEYQQNYQDWDEETRVAEAVTALAELKSLGIDSILDPTVLGLGRYVPRVRRIAEQVDLNIVVATGLYTYSDLPFQFHYNGPGLLFDMPEPLTELFVKDLTEGIGDTGVRAAFLKCAIETPGLTPGVERVLRAVGQAHVRTGAPVMVHTNPHTQSGLVAQRVLAEEGVDLSKVVLAHCGDSTDVDHLTELADAGSLLGMDRFGLDELLPFEQRVDTIVRLVERGYGDHMVIAHDASCYIDWYTPQDAARVAPRWHFRHISEDVLPALKARGLSDDDVDTLLVANLRRLFE